MTTEAETIRMETALGTAMFALRVAYERDRGLRAAAERVLEAAEALELAR